MTCNACGGEEGIEVLFRGSTVVFQVLFYDYNGELITPLGGTVTITYPVPTNASNVITVPLVAPAELGEYWIGEWDSRPSLPGMIACSVHNDGGPPFGVRDFSFDLSANRSNLSTIT